MDLTSCPASPQQWERSLKSNGTVVLCCSIRRPTFPKPGKTRRIEHYFAQLAHLWQTRWETKLYRQAVQAFESQSERNPFQPWQATMDYQITYWNPPLLSIRIDIQEQKSTPYAASLCIGEVWDCSNGFPCSLRSFLPDKRCGWKRFLTERIKEQAQVLLASGESLLDTDRCPNIQQLLDPNRFYLTENGLVIFFPQCTLGSYGEGIPTFTIPVEPQIQSNKFRAPSNTARR